MNKRSVFLELTTWQGLRSEESAITRWSARLTRSGGDGPELVATARGLSYDESFGEGLLDALDDISDELGLMGLAVEESRVLETGYQRPLFITDLVVAPDWRGHNIGPHLLRWMATAMGDAASVFLVPVPLPTRLDESGEWITDWQMPRAGSGAMRKVRAAYRKGGFTHLRSGIWWTEVHGTEREMDLVRQVMVVLER